VLIILLVDDDTKFLLALRTVLEGEGYRVLSAPDGKVAVATAMQQRPDLIVTDWIMPRVDGVAFCRWLKSRPATDSIPVVMLSAALLPVPVFLSKPVSIERLLGVIVSRLDERVRLFGPFTPARNEPPVTDARVPQRTHPNEQQDQRLAGAIPRRNPHAKPL
jgi:CheY-like chemotaxis protein